MRAILILPFLFVFVGCDRNVRKSEAESSPEPSVTVITVRESEVPDLISFVGRVRPERRVDIRAEVSGKLVEREFVEGSEVKKGDLLFKIEQVDYEAAKDLALARVESARTGKEQADQFLTRMKAVRSGGISITEVEDAEFNARLAASSLEEARADLATAELDLSRTSIYAPMDGMIGRAQYNVGNFVDATSGPLASIVQLDPIRVEHSLSGPFVTQILLDRSKRDSSLPDPRDELLPHLTLSTGDTYEHAGKIVFLDNEINATTGSISGEAEFPNPDRVLRPGQFVDLVIERGQPELSLLVPQSAVQQDREGRFVLVVSKEGEVSQRRVLMGDRYGPEWVIKEGVEEGESVIIQGIEKVTPGVKVRAMEWEETTPPEKMDDPAEPQVSEESEDGGAEDSPKTSE